MSTKAGRVQTVIVKPGKVRPRFRFIRMIGRVRRFQGRLQRVRV